MDVHQDPRMSSTNRPPERLTGPLADVKTLDVRDTFPRL